MEELELAGVQSVEETAGISEMDGKYLTFWIEQQLFALPIADVVQIVGMQTTTPIPEYPYYAKGIINLRGTIIPIIDVRLRLGKEEIPYSERTCIIVANIRGIAVGFIVDSVNEVTDISQEQISLPPRMSGDNTNAYLTGIAKHSQSVILLISTYKMLGEDVMEMSI